MTWRRIILSLLFLLILPFSALSHARERGEIVGCKQIDYWDGHGETVYLLREEATGRIIELSFEQLRQRLSPPAWQQLIAIQNIRWEDGKKSIRFSVTPLANNFKQKYAKTLRKLKNARRGSSKVPKLSITKQEIALQAGTGQFNQDGLNTVVMTGDDRYFYNMAGVAAFCSLWYKVVYAEDGVTIQRVVLAETDAFFPANYFWQSDLSWQTILIHEFGHVLGYQHSTWTNDYMSYRRQMVTLDKLNDKNSNLWAQSYERDKIYYPATAAEAQTPRLLPLDGTVVDIFYAHAPDPNVNWVNLNENHPLALTNLRSFAGKPLELSVYIGKGATGKPIIKISGSELSSYQQVEGNLLLLGQETFYKKLQTQIIKKGKGQQIEGWYFGKALEVTIVVRGYMKASDSKPTELARTVWMIFQ
jgi:hypothetical protein